MSHDTYFGDTPNWECQQLVSKWRSFSLDERAEKLAQLIQAGRELMLEGVKLREPGISDECALKNLKVLLYQSYAIKHA